MIEGTTKKVAKEFFEKLSGILSVEEGSDTLPVTNVTSVRFITRANGAVIAGAALAAGILAAWLWK
jgi:hypothetical protein